MDRLLGMGLIVGSLAYGQPPPPGDVRIERIEVGMAGATGPLGANIGPEVSVEMTLVKGAPFSGEFVTETVQQLADGNRLSSRRSEVYVRDAEGRTRRETGPVTFIHDPVAKVDLVLENQKKTARQIALPDLPPPAPGQNVMFFTTRIPPPGGPMPAVIRFARPEGATADQSPFETKTEPLGKRLIEGTEAEGTRTTVTVPAGAIGNDLPLVTVSERWFSTELKTVVLSTRKDPRAGETTFRLTQLRKGEPSRHLFEIPPGFTLAAEDKQGAVIIQRMRIDNKND